jgi:hypothetical protein
MSLKADEHRLGGEEERRNMETIEEYNVPEWQMSGASIQELDKWANDPACQNAKVAADARDIRIVEREKQRQELEQNPFNPRTEISADAVHIAKRIVTHLWIIFVLMPFVLVLLYLLFVVK